MNSTIPTIVTIAGSDPSAGAGLQADLKAATALGVYCRTVVTSITVQNSKRATKSYPLPANQLREQLEAVFEDAEIKAVKIGMLANAEITEEVALFLANNAASIPIIVDPVLGATLGHLALLEQEAETILKHQLCPHITLLTPNRQEAEKLIGRTLANRQDIAQAGIAFCQEIGLSHMLIKGGHMQELAADNQVVDVLISQAGHIEWLPHAKVDTEHSHGSGCVFATAIACYLAKGEELVEAIKKAQAYVVAALQAAYCCTKTGYGAVGVPEQLLLHS